MHLQTIDDYIDLVNKLERCNPADKLAITRHLCRTDLFFLLWFACGRKDLAQQWLIDRCKEVQDEPDSCLDLWARGHYKSTIITFGKTIQDILASHGDDPLPKYEGKELTFGIFSCTRPIAKAFLSQIKREYEVNEILKEAFPDVVWENAGKEAPKWSEDTGLILKRKSNPKEATVEAWGVVEGQPTSKHFDRLVFDDLVTLDNVRSPLMIEKTNQSLGLADNLGSKNYKQRFIGTRYHFNDTYRDLIKSGTVKVRKYPATVDGTPNGEPVLLSKDALAEKRRRQGPYVFACQMLLDPVGDETQNFKRDWLRFHKGTDGAGLNKYILVDPANEKKKTSDYTAMVVIGLGADENYYLLDIIRDRLNLTQRGDVLFRLHKKWRPLTVGYEQYGMQADISYLQERMMRENYHFNVVALGGKLAKNDRIKQLIPVFEQGRFYLPESRFYTDYEGKTQDLIESFLSEEYDAFPVPVHDDVLDDIARILDPELGAIWPRIYEEEKHDRYSRNVRQSGGSSWAA
jgi:predicted phage terminase large subunit-like protein